MCTLIQIFMCADERAALKKQSNGHSKSRPIAFLIPFFESMTWAQNKNNKKGAGS